MPKDADKVIGFLKWTVTEVASGKVLAEGEKKVRLKDVAVSRSPIGYDESIALGNHFFLSRAAAPQPTMAGLSGFAFRLLKDDATTFSWEWFEVDSPTEATKIQEEGKLRISISKTPAGYDVARTDFLTPVSMRASLPLRDLPGTERWRALIWTGSTIRWPFVRDGQAVLR